MATKKKSAAVVNAKQTDLSANKETGLNEFMTTD